MVLDVGAEEGRPALLVYGDCAAALAEFARRIRRPAGAAVTADPL